MSDRNQKLQTVLAVRKQVEHGAITPEQALTRLVWAMLEPRACKVLGFALQKQKVLALEVAAHFGIVLNQASTELKMLYDLGLLNRVEQVDASGRQFVYSPVAGIEDVGGGE